MEQRPGGVEFKDIQHLVAGARGRAALEGGEVDAGLVWAGQVVGLMHDIPTCEELISRMVAECREVLERRARAFA
jgi:nitronate monooxygenase